MTEGFFGKKWDAPVTDDLEEIPLPDAECIHCRERFRYGDDGMTMESGQSTHKECNLRCVLGGIGHHTDHQYFCIEKGDPDAGLTYRQSAILVWHFNRGLRLSRDTLELLSEAVKLVPGLVEVNSRGVVTVRLED